MKRGITASVLMLLLIMCLANSGFLLGEKEEETCFLCGRNEESLMSLYRGRNSLGILCTDNFAISDIFTVRRRKMGVWKKGRENVMRLVIRGEGRGSIAIADDGKKKGIVVSISLEEKNVLQPEELTERLCESCMEKFLRLQKESEKTLTDVFLVDLMTAEIYSLNRSGNFRVREYRVSVWEEPDKIALQVAPPPPLLCGKPAGAFSCGGLPGQVSFVLPE